MTDATQHQLISDIAHEVITEIAPGELPLFRVTSKTYLDNLNKELKPRKPTDQMLGFGLDTAITFLTPVVLALTTEVVKLLAEKAKETLKEASAELVSKFVKAMVRRISPTEERDEKTPLALSREELAQLHRLMFETAKQLRLPNDKTELLVNAIVGRLAVANS
jgi:hypothetical protein